MSTLGMRWSFAGVVAAALAVAGCDGGPGPSPAAPVLTESPNPAAAGAMAPHLARAANGHVVLSWLEPDGDAYALRYSELADGQWAAPHTLVSATDLFVNWADLPSVVPIAGDVWAAHWLVMQPDAYEAYDIQVAVSSDAGAHWSPPQALNIDGTMAEHGFVSLFAWGEDIGALWLDGRNEANFEFPEEGTDVPVVGTSLRYARLAPDGRVLARGAIDELVCDCCKTDVAITAAGPVVVYRDRSEEEIRDVAVRRYAGQAWSEPVEPARDNWQIAGCPVNGPALAARGDTLAVAWFTAADDRPRVRFARSLDAGATFSAPLDLDTENPDGQVDVELLANGDAIVSWWRANPSGGTSLAARRITPGGELGPLWTIANNMGGQALDIPQMVRGEHGLVFAWTDAGGEGGVRTGQTRNWPE